MKLEIRRIIGLHLSAPYELTIWRNFQVLASIRNALESREGLKRIQIELQALHPSLRNQVWVNNWFKLPKAKLWWKCLIDLHWPSHLVRGFKSSLESNFGVKYSMYNQVQVQWKLDLRMNFDARIFPDRKSWVNCFRIEKTSESIVFSIQHEQCLNLSSDWSIDVEWLALKPNWTDNDSLERWREIRIYQSVERSFLSAFSWDKGLKR